MRGTLWTVVIHVINVRHLNELHLFKSKYILYEELN